MQWKILNNVIEQACLKSKIVLKKNPSRKDQKKLVFYKLFVTQHVWHVYKINFLLNMIDKQQFIKKVEYCKRDKIWNKFISIKLSFIESKLVKQGLFKAARILRLGSILMAITLIGHLLRILFTMLCTSARCTSGRNWIRNAAGCGCHDDY